jgi:hypothetical protein
MIIERNRYYRVTYLGGLTRDAEKSPSSPGGQKAGALDVRGFPQFKPRVPKGKWMLLGAVIAHPRIWTPEEKSLKEGLTYLFLRAPQPLLDQIATIGYDLASPNDSIFIKSTAPSGLLYLFVNDLWQTAGDNSGGPRLSIEPVEEPDASGILFTLEHRIETDARGKQNEVNKWRRSSLSTTPA